MIYLYYLVMLFVIGSHIFFAYGQWFKWPELCKKLTDLEGIEVSKTAFLGRSIASYNASIGVGLLLSFLLDSSSGAWVQGVTLALVIATATVGSISTKGNFIRNYRLLPAILALLCLVIVLTSSPIAVSVS